MPISQTDLRRRFTSDLVSVYRENIPVTQFLSSDFKEEKSATKFVKIEVQRGSEKVAVDVFEGEIGNRNTFGRSSERTIKPPMYREYFDCTDDDLYDVVFGTDGSVSTANYAQLIANQARNLLEMRKTILRAQEVQASQVLESGIVELKNGQNIDFKRKASSLVDLGAGNYFDSAIDPYPAFEAGAEFLRDEGKSGDSEFNAILGSEVLRAFQKNEEVLKKNDLTNVKFDNMSSPIRDARSGASYHGSISNGSYITHLWTYPQKYEDKNGVLVPYVNPKKVIMKPANPMFKMCYAALPRIIKPGQIGTQVTNFQVGEYTDERLATHEIDIKSRFVAVPVAIDQLFTFKGIGG